MLSHETRCRWYFLPVVALLMSLSLASTWATASPVIQFTWLEPRGLSVVELVGQIPDEHLQGTILSYGDMDGIVVYESGSRVGDTVVITTKIYTRYSTPHWAPGHKLTTFGCLGQSPHFDHLGSVVPPSTLRVYDAGGTEVTSEIEHMFIANMDLKQPSTNSSDPFRYLPEIHYGVGGDLPLPMGPEGLEIPPNSGCQILIFQADYYPLTGVFTLELEPSVRASVLGTQQATFQSYIGPGSLGIFQPLMEQLRAEYPDRHDRIFLSAPAGADFFLLKYPAMPGDPYTDSHLEPPPYYNAHRLSSGTYRLSKGSGELSLNLTVSAGYPLAASWRDADQSSGSTFLPLLEAPTELAPPEYVIPVGLASDRCFLEGNCSSEILEQIYNAQMELDIVYLRVTRPVVGGQWIPLQMAGPAWSPSATGSLRSVLESADVDISIPHFGIYTETYHVFLPLVATSDGEMPPGCPCGWFDALGRMLDFYPGQ
jgi:hypothetical protein